MGRAVGALVAVLGAVLVALTVGSCAPATPTAATTSTPSPVVVERTLPPPVAPRLPAVMGASVPVRVQIAAIAVDSELMELGLRDDGSLDVPPAAFPAGWFSGAPTPGERGPAIIVGHIDWVTGPGVFARLAMLAVGDEIRVTRTDGSVAVFRTTLVERYPKDAFPTDLVYGDLDHAGLRVVSCGGEFDRSTGHYEDNVIAFAELVT